MEHENHYSSNEKSYASRGVGNTALGLSIGALAGELLGGGLGNIFGGGRTGCSSEDHCVNRYEAAQAAKIAELETAIKLRDANIYTDSKIADVYERLNNKIGCIEAQICQQNVLNTQLTANLSCMQGNINTLMGLTKTIIPIGNVCPAPMPQYNSWTAPTAPATGA